MRKRDQIWSYLIKSCFFGKYCLTFIYPFSKRNREPKQQSTCEYWQLWRKRWGTTRANLTYKWLFQEVIVEHLCLHPLTKGVAKIQYITTCILQIPFWQRNLGFVFVSTVLLCSNATGCLLHSSQCFKDELSNFGRAPLWPKKMEFHIFVPWETFFGRH